MASIPFDKLTDYQQRVRLENKLVALAQALGFEECEMSVQITGYLARRPISAARGEAAKYTIQANFALVPQEGIRHRVVKDLSFSREPKR